MDSIIRDFGLSLAADGKKPKTIRTYTDAASWLASTGGPDRQLVSGHQDDSPRAHGFPQCQLLTCICQQPIPGTSDLL